MQPPAQQASDQGAAHDEREEEAAGPAAAPGRHRGGHPDAEHQTDQPQRDRRRDRPGDHVVAGAQRERLVERGIGRVGQAEQQGAGAEHAPHQRRRRHERLELGQGQAEAPGRDAAQQADDQRTDQVLAVEARPLDGEQRSGAVDQRRGDVAGDRADHRR
jgi:hypothetical protein